MVVARITQKGKIMTEQKYLDGFLYDLQKLRDRIGFNGGSPDVLEVHRDLLIQLGRDSLLVLFASRKDIFPSYLAELFRPEDCAFLGQRVFEHLFGGKVAVNFSTSPILKFKIRAFYPSGKECLIDW